MWCLADDESTSLHENNNGAGKSYAEEDTCMSHEEKDTCLRGNDNGACNRNLGRRHTLYQCMYACMCVSVCVCVYVCMCTCVYSVSVCMCIRVFVYVCVYQYTPAAAFAAAAAGSRNISITTRREAIRTDACHFCFTKKRHVKNLKSTHQV